MNKILFLIAAISISACNWGKSKDSTIIIVEQSTLTNTKIKEHLFLDCMYRDTYFPTFLVDKCKYILLELRQNIEKEKPQSLIELYKLTHASTDKLNSLQDEFFRNNSELETAARECLGMDFEFIAKSYGFDADVEKLIATREW